MTIMVAYTSARSTAKFNMMPRIYSSDSASVEMLMNGLAVKLKRFDNVLVRADNVTARVTSAFMQAEGITFVSLEKAIQECIAVHAAKERLSETFASSLFGRVFHTNVRPVTDGVEVTCRVRTLSPRQSSH